MRRRRVVSTSRTEPGQCWTTACQPPWSNGSKVRRRISPPSTAASGRTVCPRASRAGNFSRTFSMICTSLSSRHGRSSDAARDLRNSGSLTSWESSSAATSDLWAKAARWRVSRHFSTSTHPASLASAVRSSIRLTMAQFFLGLGVGVGFGLGFQGAGSCTCSARGAAMNWASWPRGVRSPS